MGYLQEGDEGKTNGSHIYLGPVKILLCGTAPDKKKKEIELNPDICLLLMSPKIQLRMRKYKMTSAACHSRQNWLEFAQLAMGALISASAMRKRNKPVMEKRRRRK